MKKILIIPDVHGRKFWRRAIERGLKENVDKIIFLGDYGDPYGSEEISHKDALTELEDIIQFQENNPNEEDNLSLILNEEHWDLYDQSSYLRGGYFLFGSPIWADIREHASSKERIKDYIQIFGHTMLSRPYFEDKIICLDCKKAFILENNEIKEF